MRSKTSSWIASLKFVRVRILTQMEESFLDKNININEMSFSQVMSYGLWAYL